MNAEKKKQRPRTFNSALAAWPAAMAEVAAFPCVETLDSLCTLLDVMDGAIGRTWQEDGHDRRLSVFAECRAAARQANGLVSAAALERAKARGVAAAAVRAEKKASAA